MAEVVSVRLQRAGKVYYFDPAGIALEAGDQVVVKTTRGLELGRVIIAPRQVPDSELTEPLKPVLRKAEPEDARHAQEMEEKEEQSLIECGKLIARLNLPMKLISAEYSLDGSHLLLFFSAAERIDFRELVRELSSHLKVRVELRQVGARDGAKLVGGFGRCGRTLCCATFMTDFAPVSVKMAKEQGLALNPMKISGACGRLCCCLGFESEHYSAAKEKSPKEGQRISTPAGTAATVEAGPVPETLVEPESQETAELPPDEVTIEDEP
ncbi:MAG: stage 0 sporulation family protein [Chloroflexi bacterium]|nr:stage 0 sporulation family protein [Chloroflexota bacterium]